MWITTQALLLALLVLPRVYPMTGRATPDRNAITISGTITSRADGAPVRGAVVSVSGAGRSATTTAIGRYTLDAPRSLVRVEHVQLRVDAPGLAHRTIDVAVNAARLTVDVTLSLDVPQQRQPRRAGPGMFEAASR